MTMICLETKKILQHFDRPEDRFINRELSWLAFNDRVLQEARNISYPLLERIKFLAISASNLDEFFMVRVAGLKHQAHHKKTTVSQDGLTPEQQLTHIIAETARLVTSQYRTWHDLVKALKAENIIIETEQMLDEADKTWLVDHFHRVLRPQLSPFMIESDQLLPLLPNSGVALVVTLRPKRGKLMHALIPLPPKLERFIRLPSLGQQLRFIRLEDVLHLSKQHLFPDDTVTKLGFCRIIRDGELDVSDEAEDLVSYFERAVEKRKQGSIIRMEVSGLTAASVQLLASMFLTEKQDIVRLKDFPGLVAVGSLYSTIIRADLKFKPFHARFPERINAFGGDCFAAIEAKDIIIHHPYESFDVVVKFLRQAARDPDVISIKQTLYRTSSDSEIVKALIEAAEAGKDVTAIVELKARFDEEANIRWARNLKKAGVTVIFGVAGLKVHAKMSLVLRRIGERYQSYVHFGTGNYHPVTAKTYVDLSFFTCDPVLCDDAARVFDYMSSHLSPHLQKLIVAPFTMRSSLIDLIENEVSYAKEGKPANIWIKVNSLVDKELIDALYYASQHGVRIRLIIRGICALRPGIPGFSDNITVKSIIGRFLEHARIFCFGNGHSLPSERAKVFIASADWMYRSCNRRVETVIPIENGTVHTQIMQQIMLSNLHDDKQSWMLHADGSYSRIPIHDGFSAQEYFMINRSLSGISTQASPEKHHKAHIAALPAHIGVIDIGSNSVRLVMYDTLKRVPMPLFNEKVMCGLARGLEQTGKLHEEAIGLAHQALARFIHLARCMHVKNLHVFATAAVRDAEDGKHFVAQVEARHGVKIVILSGEQEALYGAYGILSAMPEASGLIGDLGGGSLELATLRQGTVGITHSFPIGLLRLVGLSSGNTEKTIATIDHYLKKFPADAMASGCDFYAVGGGFRNLAKIYIALTHYPLRILHHYSVPSGKFLTVIRNISKIPLQTLQEISGVSGKRAETLPYTALIMERIITHFSPPNVIFSAYGVREGFLYDILPASEKSKDPLLASCSDMIAQLSELPDYGYEMAEWMHPLFDYESPEMKRLRLAACIMSSLARFEHTEYRAEIAYRRFLDSSITGIDHSSRLFIASCLFYRYKTNMDKDVMEAATILLDDDLMHTARIIGLAMRLGHNISASVPGVINKTHLIMSKTTLTLHFNKEVTDLMGDAVQKRFEKLASVIGLLAEVQLGE